MQLVGAAAPSSGPLCSQVADAIFSGRAALLICDGEDVTALIADDGETWADLSALVPRVMPDVRA